MPLTYLLAIGLAALLSTAPVDDGQRAPNAEEAAGLGGVNFIGPAEGCPRCDDTLPWVYDFLLLLQFNGPISQPSSFELEVRELLPDGAYGPNLWDEFLFEVEVADTLRIEGELECGTWFAVLNRGGWPGVSPFEQHYVVVKGDANNDGRTNALDLNQTWANRGTPTSPCDRNDNRRDGQTNALDLSSAWLWRDCMAPPKPSGHECPPEAASASER